MKAVIQGTSASFEQEDLVGLRIWGSRWGSLLEEWRL